MTDRRDRRDYMFRRINEVLEELEEVNGEQNHHPLQWFSVIGEEFGEMCKAFNKYTDGIDDGNSGDFACLKEMEWRALKVTVNCVAMLECIQRQASKGLTP